VVGNGEPDRVLQPGMLPEGTSVTVSRDFTSVSRSAAGITLAGTTGAESKYVVEGVNVDNPSFGTVGAAIVREYVSVVEVHGPSTSGRPQAHVRLGRIEGDDAVDRRALRAAVRKQRTPLRRCLETSPLYEAEGALELVVELAVDATGSIRVTLREGSLGGPAYDACVTTALRAVAATLPAAATVTLSLRLFAS
jgi:Ca-activated chloride channel family protein